MSIKKAIDAVFFRSTGRVKAIDLETKDNVAKWYTATHLPEFFLGESISGRSYVPP